MKQFSDYNISIKPGSTGEIKTTCPQCSASRKKKTYPCLNVNIEKSMWHCWHCGWSGNLANGVWNQTIKIKPTYSKPFLRNSKISSEWVDWLKKRGIGSKTITENGITNTKIYMPQTEEEVDTLCFPFLRDGEIINCKYRDKDKNFRMAAGAE
ncbi:MAG: topoisomerase, partial [Candidatus Riflebacteria bacterium]